MQNQPHQSFLSLWVWLLASMESWPSQKPSDGATVARIKRTSKPQTSYNPVHLGRNKILQHYFFGFLGNISNNSLILWLSAYFFSLQDIKWMETSWRKFCSLLCGPAYIKMNATQCSDLSHNSRKGLRNDLGQGNNAQIPPWQQWRILPKRLSGTLQRWTT